MRNITDYLGAYPHREVFPHSNAHISEQVGDVLVQFFGVSEDEGQGSSLPSAKFHFEVNWSSSSVSLFLTFSEIGNDDPKDASYDTDVYIGGDSVGLTSQIEAINAVREFATKHQLLDLDCETERS